MAFRAPPDMFRGRNQSYSPYAPDSEKPTKLCVAVTDTFSLDSAIKNSLDLGCGLDSSYRHKCENFAPLTLVTTLNEQNHMVPGMCSFQIGSLWPNEYPHCS
jgi:hypothetical protein